MRHLICLILLLITTFTNAQIMTPDTSISGIKLQDPNSLVSKVPNITSVLETFETGNHAFFLNSSATEKLELVFHAGSSANEVAEIHVYALTGDSMKESKALKLNIDTFVTESNIKLGMTQKNIVKIKGKTYIMNEFEGEVILYYILNDFENSKFLKRYNYPEYHAVYTFNRDKLIKIDFGFAYP